VLRSLGGGCQVPIGAHATLDDGGLRLVAVVAAPDGSVVVRRRLSGPAEEARLLGEALGAELLAAGAREILEQVYGARDPAI
jgi:hydroxymethylbilane synthase